VAHHGYDISDLPPMRKKVAKTAEKLKHDFDEAEYWATENAFCREVLDTRRGFQNHGFRLFNEKGDLLNVPKNPQAFWKKNGRAINRYVKEVWREWNIFSNAIAFWNPDMGLATPPICLPLQRVEYKDVMGLEELIFQHELSRDKVEELGWQATKGYDSGKVTFTDDSPERFQVLKDGKLGDGLSIPKMKTVRQCCNSIARLQDADGVYAEAANMLIMQHKLGHEIKSGPWAGSPNNFASKARIEKIRKAFNGKLGLVRFTGNFDHTIDFSTLDSKLFDSTKYDGAERWLMWWSFPIGQMLEAKGTTAPFLMPLLKGQVASQRELVGPFLEETIAQAFGMDQELKITWSDTCFRDPREVAAYARYLHKAGPLSAGTALEEAGYDPGIEAANKVEEAKIPDNFLPIYDESHGNQPGSEMNPPGRPAGSPTK